MQPASDSDPADWWAARGDVDRWARIRYGAPDFETYLRVAFSEDEADGWHPVSAVLDLLIRHSEPQPGYAAVWEGWGGNGTPSGPRIDLVERVYLLGVGALDELRSAPNLLWGLPPHDSFPPHLAWPADHSWMFACEVDEEIEFTLGCSAHVAAVVAQALPGLTRAVPYGVDAPLYRDE